MRVQIHPGIAVACSVNLVCLKCLSTMTLCIPCQACTFRKKLITCLLMITSGGLASKLSSQWFVLELFQCVRLGAIGC
jgi:hypothetical protein